MERRRGGSKAETDADTKCPRRNSLQVTETTWHSVPPIKINEPMCRVDGKMTGETVKLMEVFFPSRALCFHLPLPGVVPWRYGV